jgi:hypothetical protein
MTRCQCSSCWLKVRVRLVAVVVAGHAGEQPRAARRPVLAHVVLLGGDGRCGLGAERDELLGADLQPAARPLPDMDPQSRSQDRHPHAQPRAARAVPTLFDNARRLRELTSELVPS